MAAIQMPNRLPLRALVFDAYGTLFDVHSISLDCESLFPGKGADLSRLWRNKQLEYSWLRSLMGRYVEFEVVTKDALVAFTRTVADEVRESNVCVVILSPGASIATEDAPEEARQRMPGPDFAGNRFVLAGEAPMDYSGHLLTLQDGRLVVEA